MALTLYYHPLSSFCWKVLIALYENATPFQPCLVDLGDATGAAAFKAIWPIGKFPVLRDDSKQLQCRSRLSSSSISPGTIRAGRACSQPNPMRLSRCA
jgi:glutathione S-transferase